MPVTGELQGNIFLKMLWKKKKKKEEEENQLFEVAGFWSVGACLLFIWMKKKHNSYCSQQWGDSNGPTYAKHMLSHPAAENSPYIFIPRSRIYQCVQISLCSSSVRKDWMWTISEASPESYAGRFPQRTTSLSCHAPGIFWQWTTVHVIVCPPGCIHITHVPKPGAVQNRQSCDNVGGTAVYTQTTAVEIIWGP